MISNRSSVLRLSTVATHVFVGFGDQFQPAMMAQIDMVEALRPFGQDRVEKELIAALRPFRALSGWRATAMGGTLDAVISYPVSVVQ